MTKLEKLSVTLAEENSLRTSSPLRSLSSPSPCHLVEALVESPLYEKVNCRVRLLVHSGPSSWDGQVKRLADLCHKLSTGFNSQPDIEERYRGSPSSKHSSILSGKSNAPNTTIVSINIEPLL